MFFETYSQCCPGDFYSQSAPDYTYSLKLYNILFFIHQDTYNTSRIFMASEIISSEKCGWYCEQSNSLSITMPTIKYDLSIYMVIEQCNLEIDGSSKLHPLHAILLGRFNIIPAIKVLVNNNNDRIKHLSANSNHFSFLR